MHTILTWLSLLKRYDLEKNHKKSETKIVVQKSNLCSDEMDTYVLGRKDSNLRIAGPKPVALPLGHAPFIRYIFNTNKPNTGIGCSSILVQISLE